MSEAWVLAAQGLSLIWFAITSCASVILSLPGVCLGLLQTQTEAANSNGATFYEGTVSHIRRSPKEHKFSYPVRLAVMDLDCLPAWFSPAQAADHLTADQARQLVATSGRVRLLTNPQAAGYVQNPISVYYCYEGDALARCICEVTNTPWGERVTFVFNPDGESVKKPLHVSPFMDMQNTWYLEAPAPGPERLRLTVLASHPTHGKYFDAHLVAKRSRFPHRPNEAASWATLWQYGFMPHRVAFWIYLHAIKLLWKGVPFYGQPDRGDRPRMNSKCAENTHDRSTEGWWFKWRAPLQWPWNG